ncbi:hypothetical protein ACU6U9_17475 [Pseudomonas sp. HK3]
MNKIVVFGTVILCFISYGIWPLAASALLVSISDEPTVGLISVVIWSIAVVIQIIAMWQIFKRNPKGLHLFFSVIFLYVLLYTGDELMFYLESDEPFPFSSILNKAIYPFFAIWVLYFSDAKDFFNQSIKS